MRVAVGLALLLAGCLAPAPTAPAEADGPAALPPAAFTTLRCGGEPIDPCNVRATVGMHAHEVDLAIDPADPDHMVLVAKAEESRTISLRTASTARFNLHAATFDGGKTWTSGTFQPAVDATDAGIARLAEPEEFESDPIVVFAPDGAPLALTLHIVPGEGRPDRLTAYRSEDGGRTFAEVARPFEGFWFADKPWAAVDRAAGVVYVVANAGKESDFSDAGAYVLKTFDGGRTWTDPVAACIRACFSSYVAVGPSGEVVIAGTDENVVFSRSDDGGATWSEPVPIAPFTGFDGLVARTYRATNFASIAADASDGPRRGAYYVVWGTRPADLPPPVCVELPGAPRLTCATGGVWDIVFSRSDDGGRTWSEPRRVNDDANPLATQATPLVRTGSRGDVHVAWFDARSDPVAGFLLDVVYAQSLDGESFGANVVLTDRPFASGLLQIHDYLGLAATESKVVVAFPDTRYGPSDVFVATVE